MPIHDGPLTFVDVPTLKPGHYLKKGKNWSAPRCCSCPYVLISSIKSRVCGCGNVIGTGWPINPDNYEFPLPAVGEYWEHPTTCTRRTAQTSYCVGLKHDSWSSINLDFIRCVEDGCFRLQNFGKGGNVSTGNNGGGSPAIQQPVARSAVPSNPTRDPLLVGYKEFTDYVSVRNIIAEPVDWQGFKTVRFLHEKESRYWVRNQPQKMRVWTSKKGLHTIEV